MSIRYYPDEPQADLINRRELSALLGGIHASIVYRLIARGILPKPLHVGGSSRWIRAEIVAVLAKLEAQR